MAIVHYRPSLSLANEIHNGMGWLLDPGCSESATDKAGLWQPHVDIKEEESRYVIFADIPGVNSKDIKISVEQNTLAIQGDKKSEKEENDNGYYRIERISGQFYRQFVLPKNADTNDINAKCTDGVLEVSIPKTEVSSTRYIDVN